MPNYYTPIQQPKIQNALLNFAPVNNALEGVRDQNNANRNALLQQSQMDLQTKQFEQNSKTVAMQQEKMLAERSGGLAQMALQEKDPTRRSAIMQRIYSMSPDYTKNLVSHGIDPNDHNTVANFLVAEARGYQNPQDAQLKALQIQNAQSNLSTDALTREQLRMKIAQEKNLNSMFNQPAPQAQPEAAGPVEGAGRFAAPNLTQQPQAQNQLQAAVANLSPEKQLAFKLAWQSGDRESAIKMIQASTEGLGPYKGAKEVSDVEEGLRKEYATIAKPYFEVRDAYTRINQSAQDPSAAGDLALIFNYMKMLDPGSVVREGEFATAQNAAGVPDRIRNLANRLVNGERLNENQRNDFVGQARGLMTRQERQYQKIQDQYRGIAKRRQIDPQNVIIDFTAPPDEPKAPPPPPAQRKVYDIGDKFSVEVN